MVKFGPVVFYTPFWLQADIFLFVCVFFILSTQDFAV